MTIRNIFRYPGSKTRLAGWIASQFPPHERYVEPFGGSAAVLLHKEPSTVEILNDINSDITQFFRVLRDRGDELADWYAATPFSRELHDTWKTKFNQGERPDDPIERAGQFVYLRTTSVNGQGGFSTRRRDRDPTNAFQSQPAAIRRFANRLQSVVVENLDYHSLIKKYDGEDAVFYFDPPYPDAEDSLYKHGSINHSEFATTLAEMDAHWLVSYQSIPDEIRAISTHILSTKTRNNLRSGSSTGAHNIEDTERLVCNFDPTCVPSASPTTQLTLTDSVSPESHTHTLNKTDAQ
ncbi:DNA adenine methylase [Salinibaculum rarum]|uniref:DNA adenine methylase n=1 Tax=Salinibaculum rarum TaxID=3058903 RepID=UPI00265ED79C|nr:DNA adenine methylase [Salinibaculum sp. KK48]